MSVYRTGALFTADSLDYEMAALLEVTVRATDSVTGEMSEALVSVVLTDVNDNAPRFTQKSYNISLLESAAVGTFIALIKAEDNDTGESTSSHIFNTLLCFNAVFIINGSVSINLKTFRYFFLGHYTV